MASAVTNLGGTALIAIGEALAPPSWTTQLKPASFRGISFYVRGHDQDAGRRVVRKEYPLRDAGSTEDMGRRLEEYQVDAYVIGNDYLAQASALYRACVLSDQTGTLVHPYLGNITVRCAGFRRREVDREGAIARIALTFVEAGGSNAPLAAVDTSSTALGWAANAFQAVAALYSLAVVVADHPGFLLGFLTGQLAGLAGAMLGLPGAALAGFGALVAAITATPSDTVAVPAAITTALSTYADGVAGVPAGTYPNGADISFGLASLATFGASYAPVPLTTPDRVQQATNQAALVMTVQASAAIAMAQVYAQTIFVSSNAAQAAATQLTDLLDSLATQAADAGWNALYDTLMGLYAAVTNDMQQRAQQLAALAPYSTADSLPSLVLAQLLYQDATRAPQLEALNDAQDPNFMPMAGVALSS